MKRSEFLKLSCTGCLLGAAGIAGMGSLLGGCSPATGNAVVKTPVADRKMQVALARLSGQPVTVIRGAGMDYDVAVHKLEQGGYEALLLRCTHFSNPLVVNGSTYSCTLHGSEFDQAGKVKKGPASQPLQQLRCEVAGEQLIIYV